MKNKISKCILLMFVVTLFVSCDDELDQTPFDEFGTENAFVTAADFENGIRGAYSALTRGGLHGNTLLSTPDVLTDNVTLSQLGRFTQEQLHEWEYNPSATTGALYSDAYILIFRANQVLQFIEDFEGPSRASITAEAKALRAYGHLSLVSMFSQIPTQSSGANGSLGVAYVTTADANIEPARNTVAEVYEFIIQDLIEAEADIDINEDNRLNRDGINILLSRAYLYMGQWQNAIDAANQVSTPIASRDSFAGIWNDSNDDGLVFSFENMAPVLGNSIGVTWSQGPLVALIPEYVVSFEFFNLFSDDDIRKEAYLAPATADGNDVNAIIKLLGRDALFNGEVNYKILRASEAALNAAEAHFNLGNEALALAALNELRTRRYTTPSDGETGNALRDAIRLERRLELAFEGHHFFDLKRFGLGVQRTNDGDFADGSGTPSGTLTLPAGSNLLQLPIPQQAIDVNQNLIQNPGY